MTDQPIYAVGDIHGHLDQLEKALARIEADGGAEARIVFLGDLVDRGPDSPGVIDRLEQGQAEGRNWIVLRGNHDDIFQGFLESGRIDSPHTQPGRTYLHEAVGGLATLAAYGVDITSTDIARLWAEAQEKVPFRHLTFLQSLPRFHLEGDLLFVHAGIRPGLPLAQQTPDDLIWIRRDFLDHTGRHPWLVVHGHTPAPTAEHRGNRVNLDAGAGFGHPLACARFHQGQVHELTPYGPAPLLPRETAVQ